MEDYARRRDGRSAELFAGDRQTFFQRARIAQSDLSHCSGCGNSPRFRSCGQARGRPKYDFNWLSTTGTGIFIAAVLTAVWLRLDSWFFSMSFRRTLFRVRWGYIDHCCMLALAFVTKYSGADATLGWRLPIPAGFIRFLPRF